MMLELARMWWTVWASFWTSSSSKTSSYLSTWLTGVTVAIASGQLARGTRDGSKERVWKRVERRKKVGETGQNKDVGTSSDDGVDAAGYREGRGLEVGWCASMVGLLDLEEHSCLSSDRLNLATDRQAAWQAAKTGEQLTIDDGTRSGRQVDRRGGIVGMK